MVEIDSVVALTQVYRQMGAVVPDLEDPASWHQCLILFRRSTGKVIAGLSDRSDGGFVYDGQRNEFCRALWVVIECDRWIQ